ncbi:MAG: hypothetical protein KDB07_07580 [Planctomycetes bacterium]|nr:hypothetical protein [Planctomycetota bacterium]
MPDNDNQQPSKGEAAKRKPYVPPKVYSDDLFESKGLACLKVNTLGPNDCSNLLPGSSKIS